MTSHSVTVGSGHTPRNADTAPGGPIPWTSLPFPEGLEITPGIDGHRIWFKGRLVSTHNTLSSAARGLTAARQVLAVLGDLAANENGGRR